VHACGENHERPGSTTSRRGQDLPWKSQSEWQRTGINRESTSMAWPTLGSRTAKEQNRTGRNTIKGDMSPGTPCTTDSSSVGAQRRLGHFTTNSTQQRRQTAPMRPYAQQLWPLVKPTHAAAAADVHTIRSVASWRSVSVWVCVERSTVC